jgi:hypothetical protein
LPDKFYVDMRQALRYVACLEQNREGAFMHHQSDVYQSALSAAFLAGIVMVTLTGIRVLVWVVGASF